MTKHSVTEGGKMEQCAKIQPRPLTQSEIVSLRQDAISTSEKMKKLICERATKEQG